MNDLTADKERQKVWELIKDIRIAQIVTHAEGEMLAARPMAALNREFTGILWFYTKVDSPKIAEIDANPNVLLAYSEPAKQEYISIQGKAEILNDRQKINEFWSEYCRIWFPQGKEDESIRLLKVTVERAEYWDSPASKLVMIYSYAIARFTGEVPEVGQNRKVAF